MDQKTIDRESELQILSHEPEEPNRDAQKPGSVKRYIQRKLKTEKSM